MAAGEGSSTMKVVRGFDKKDFAGWESVITIGGFDGIHTGHAAILSHLCEMARSTKAKAVVITFAPLPREYFKGESFKILTTVGEKLAILEQVGIDGVFIISFTPELSRMQPSRFLGRLWDSFQLRGIVVGRNHHFGKDGRGGIPVLRAYASQKHVALDVVENVMFRDEMVSSSRIRTSIAQGNVKEAHEMLGRPFSFSATVAKGNGIGKELSYPTANLEVIASQKVLPSSGVYAAKVSLNGGEYGAMLYLGKRPTFFEKGRSSIEAYIMGYNGNLYGKEISVGVIERIRAERKFSSQENLKEQIMNDEVTARKIIKNLTVTQGG